MSIFFALILAVGLVSVGWQLWVALSTGKVREEIWFGADRREDHYGFVLRVLLLLTISGVLIFLAMQLPALMRALGE